MSESRVVAGWTLRDRLVAATGEPAPMTIDLVALEADLERLRGNSRGYVPRHLRPRRGQRARLADRAAS